MKWQAFIPFLIVIWRWRMDEAQLIMARTMYGEARGEGDLGMIAVGYVIRNRAAAPSWWGDSIISVAQKPWQFSTWNANDPNLPVIRDLKPGQGDAIFDRAWQLAGDVIAGRVSDPTAGATSYFNPHIVKPAWAASMQKVASIGNHEFYA